ncbi:MAG TPA: ATP-dependent Clp protease proteolytic subunit [Candidatus Acidoferrales bacterium]|nr:ATP-dependent Clp protease proteolytic subunit [Candidatus Acidoferrales bacterium]
MYRGQSGGVPLTGSVIPTVLDQSMRGERAYDIYSLLLKERIVFLGQEVDDQIANLLVAEILYLEGQDPDRDIHLYINSPGGPAYSGMAIYDVMQHVKCEVATLCIGMAMSAAAMILCGGALGKRMALPSSKIMIHQGSAGTRGAPRDMEIQLREVLANTQRMAEILAHHSGRPLEQVERDIDRDYYLTANEALEYGLIDEVLAPRRGLSATVAQAAEPPAAATALG